ncbi:hypothetical protein Dimus_011050, partial [Dionaea muscipula]
MRQRRHRVLGTFGQVLECWDREMREIVAIKIVRSIKKYQEAAMIEVDAVSKDGSQSKRLPKSCAIKVIDFGSTTRGHQVHHYIVSMRHYRALEDSDGVTLVICGVLAASWQNYAQYGILLSCLWDGLAGEALFQTHENLEHLAMMERVLGPLPKHIIRRADRHAEKYVRKGRLNWPDGAVSKESIRA